MSAEQQSRDLLERLGMPRAQSLTAGDVIELANLITDANRVRSNVLRPSDTPQQFAAIMRVWRETFGTDDWLFQRMQTLFTPAPADTTDSPQSERDRLRRLLDHSNYDYHAGVGGVECPLCSALVWDRDHHSQWHLDRLEEKGSDG